MYSTVSGTGIFSLTDKSGGKWGTPSCTFIQFKIWYCWSENNYQTLTDSIVSPSYGVNPSMELHT